MKDRLFTFGCSYTNYFWPTWSDFIGLNFNHYENWGWGGAGNYYIAAKIYECHLINNFTKDDTILIMLSSPYRLDFIDNSSCFVTRGSIFSEGNMKIFGKNLIENVWSVEHGIHNTWFMLESIKNLLNNIGCKYKIYKAFSIEDYESKRDYSLLKDETIRIKNCLRKINESTYSPTLQNFWEENMKKERVYSFSDGNDGHPTLKTHYKWVKSHMPEFYNEKMDYFLEKWENMLTPVKNKIDLIEIYKPWMGFHDKDLRRHQV